VASHYESSPDSYDEHRMMPSGRRPSDQAKWLGLRVRQYAARSHTHRHHLLLLSQKADTNLTIPWKIEGWNDLGTAVGVQPVPKAVYHSGFYDKPATAHTGIRTLVLSHRSQARYR